MEGAIIISEKKKSYIILSVMILLQLGILLYYMNIRTALFYDEIWSYGLANSYDKAFFYPNGFHFDKKDNFYNNWIDGKEFFNYITVQASETFAYDKVYENQFQDVHPPLYYYILHTICSFMPDSFSRWSGQCLNLVVFILTQFVLFRLTKGLFKSSNKALLLCAFFGFGMGAVNTFIYIRMYALLTFFCVLFAERVFRIIERDQINTNTAIKLFVTIFLGCLTHNYFLLFLFALSLGILVYCFISKKFKLILEYAAVVILATSAFYIYFPGILHQASSLRIKEGTIGIGGSFPLENLFANFAFISNYTIGIDVSDYFALTGKICEAVGNVVDWFPTWLVLLVMILLLVFILKKNLKYKNQIVMGFAIIIYSLVLASYTMLTRSGPYSGRYIFNTLPFFCIIWFSIICGLLYSCISLRKQVKGLIVFAMMIFCVCSHYNSCREWCFDVPPDREEIAERIRGTNCIFVIDSFSKIFPEPIIHGKALDFMYTKKVFPTRTSDAPKILNAIKSLNKNEKNIIFLPATIAGKDVLGLIKDKSELKPVYAFEDITNVCSFYVLRLE